MTTSTTNTLAGVRWTAAEVSRALGLPHSPTPEQTAVIEAPLRPLLVIAGAGSGKTETMAARVVWLVANGFVEPEDVLGLTFTRKAATELADRIGNRLARLRSVGLSRARAAAGLRVRHPTAVRGGGLADRARGRVALRRADGRGRQGRVHGDGGGGRPRR